MGYYGDNLWGWGDDTHVPADPAPAPATCEGGECGGDSLAQRAVESIGEAIRLIVRAVLVLVFLVAIALPWVLRGATVALAVYGGILLFANLYEKLGAVPIAAAPAATIAILPAILAVGEWATKAQGAAFSGQDDGGTELALSGQNDADQAISGWDEYGLWGAFLTAGVGTYVLARIVAWASHAQVAVAIGVLTVVCWMYIAFIMPAQAGDNEPVRGGEP